MRAGVLGGEKRKQEGQKVVSSYHCCLWQKFGGENKNMNTNEWSAPIITVCGKGGETEKRENSKRSAPIIAV